MDGIVETGGSRKEAHWHIIQLTHTHTMIETERIMLSRFDGDPAAAAVCDVPGRLNFLVAARELVS